MSWEQRNAEFCKAQTDAEFVYIEAERRVKALEDENAKLRNDLEDANNQAEEVCIENAKLRELVRDMRKAFIHGPCYRWCEHMPEPCNGDKCQYVNRMRELGIEVDE